MAGFAAAAAASAAAAAVLLVPPCAAPALAVCAEAAAVTKQKAAASVQADSAESRWASSLLFMVSLVVKSGSVKEVCLRPRRTGSAVWRCVRHPCQPSGWA
ncbi:hypothetical protein D3C86_1705850 [compost metagenome]